VTDQTERTEPLTAEQQWQRDHDMLKQRNVHHVREAEQRAQRQKANPADGARD
jgi:hypothetical protein